ncbi:hypothetical protein I8J32_006970 [Lysobacter solisilvae]|uniref:Uncharacterized protein n=1 Tax=Agrilutibacter solisilvae TaxID=2763317 RepID=A0A974Y1B5_9GAMM|nr:hypothetical protein [Lysobacter solisilvae]QSX79586.1 hypothetical protein I8J32_006970 [Lysobacter solisilvae]
MQASLVDVDVIDRDRGDWLEQFRHRGQPWIAGEPGHRYAVRLTNSSGERVLVVLSIDGVNAVTGQTAHPSQAGYVLEPWQSTEINGWRKSMDDVAQFVFTDLPDSYAARTGRPDNVGVIGVAVFTEARTYYYPQPAPIYQPRNAPGTYERDAAASDGAAAPPSAASSARADKAIAREEARQQSLGTGHGAREWSPVSHTGFERASRSPAQVTQLRYDDYYALVARGVVPRYRRDRWNEDAPHAFPGGFVADPPGW